ncbi:thiamineS protein [Hydrogenobacter thermophilus TK-6]|uniref:Molybdopterin converting factor n=1 Tax=Hydrogenobacter thermophilus (strain DSM 6534 / IAM 12695 / TK-6) TaxID=608538 RepID=D3DID9_HYDTT|nr:MoaD/ThiS family protein [Hydrogenobacter thermophilus]ADO45516.1 thiamineS protein [Hydrogenobacter thermophilus TK-6]BAI69591.1 molybdopterin converting factor [Hydrogenobacter thermophilus TK-6]
MMVRLLGYLGYIAGEQIVKIGEVTSVREVLNEVAKRKGIGNPLYSGDGIWEGILFILNGRVIQNLEEPVSEDDELVITFPTAGE